MSVQLEHEVVTSPAPVQLLVVHSIPDNNGFETVALLIVWEVASPTSTPCVFGGSNVLQRMEEAHWCHGSNGLAETLCGSQCRLKNTTADPSFDAPAVWAFTVSDAVIAVFMLLSL